MRVFIDTNILVDFICRREPFYAEARELVKLCMSGEERGVIAAHTLLNIDYLTRKNHSLKERREFLRLLAGFLDVIGVNKRNIMSAVDDDLFPDLEDGVQYQCALEEIADIIITRDANGFKASKIPCKTAAQFLADREAMTFHR